MLVFGSSPNTLGQPQKSLVAVASSQWTSSPITISHPGASPHRSRGHAPDSGAARSSAPASANSIRSPKAGAIAWTPTGRP